LTHLAIDVYPKDAPIPPGEEWFYELDGRVHGPLSRADLEELLNGSGETALQVRVRQGAEGPWHPFRTASAAPATLPTPQPSWDGDLPVRSSQAPQSRLSAGKGGLGRLLRSNWDLCAGLVVWLLLNGLFLLWFQDPYSRERNYLQTLRTISSEVHELREKSASEAEWRAFAQRTHVALDPIVRDLKKSANASEPAKQQLLWAARDLTPRTLGPRTKERDEFDRRLNTYLNTAEAEIRDR
jgi:hypothetical protein